MEKGTLLRVAAGYVIFVVALILWLDEDQTRLAVDEEAHTALALAEHIGAAPDLKVAPVLDTELATLADRLGGGGGARLRVTVVVAVVADWPAVAMDSIRKVAPFIVGVVEVILLASKVVTAAGAVLVALPKLTAVILVCIQSVRKRSTVQRMLFWAVLICCGHTAAGRHHQQYRIALHQLWRHYE